MLSSSPSEGEAAHEADSNSAEPKKSHTAKNRRKKEKKKLKSRDGAGGCHQMEDVNVWKQRSIVAKRMPTLQSLQQHEIQKMHPSLLANPNSHLLSVCHSSDLEGASSQVLVPETRDMSHESLAMCSTRGRGESAPAAESRNGITSQLSSGINATTTTRRKTSDKNLKGSPSHDQEHTCSFRFSSSIEVEDSEEGDVARRFLECDNWSECPWREEPFDIRPHALLKCGSCHIVRYCSKECQRVDWAEHKGMCSIHTKLRGVERLCEQHLTFEQECVSDLANLQKDAQNAQNQLQESLKTTSAGGHSKVAEAKIIQDNQKALIVLKVLETAIKQLKETTLARHNLPRSDEEGRWDKVGVILKTIPKFVTKFGVVMKGRALRVGQWLCAQHESKRAKEQRSKGAMEFELKAAIEHATRWLDRNKHTFEEAEDNTGGDMAAFDPTAHMMEQLFLVAEIKGLTQVKYLTLSEAKVEAVKRGKSPSGQFENLGVFSGITEKLIKDIESYDEKRSVIVLVHLKMEEVRGGEPVLCWFVN